MSIEQISDSTVFNIKSDWYKQAVALFKECAAKNYTAGHRHHWIPCAIVAEFLFKKHRPANYRDITDKAYPQLLIRMPVNAHILIHYYIWRAVKSRFKQKMRYAFEKLCGMADPLGEYAVELNICLKSGKLRRIREKRSSPKKSIGMMDPGIASSTPFLKDIPRGITPAAAHKLCVEAWKVYTGSYTWPKFQHNFMKAFRAARKNQKVYGG